MAWVKIPPENNALLRTLSPRDPRVTTIAMFGGVCGTVNGHMFGGTFGRAAIARLGPDDLAEALRLDGATIFDPMGRGALMRDMVFFPETILDEPEELRGWLARAFAYTATLPPKPRKGSAAAKATKPTPAPPKPAKPRAASKPAKPRAKATLAKPRAKPTPARTGAAAKPAKPRAKAKPAKARRPGRATG